MKCDFYTNIGMEKTRTLDMILTKYVFDNRFIFLKKLFLVPSLHNLNSREYSEKKNSNTTKFLPTSSL